MTLSRSHSSDQLRRISGGCALAFLLCIIVLVLLEANGVQGRFVASVLFPLALCCAAGVATSTADPTAFEVAGRRVSAPFAGMAAAAQWSAPVLLFAAPSSLFVAGYDGRPMLIGLTGGYVLLTVLIAPFVRNSAACTLPGFIAARFGTIAGLIAVLVLLICSVLFMASLVQTGAAFVARVLATDMKVALIVGVGVVLLCAVPGGLTGVIASQVAQYTIVLIACLAAFLLLAVKPFDAPADAPYDPIVQAVDILAQGLGLVPAQSPRSVPSGLTATLSNLEFIVCLMTGSAALPHVVMQPLATAGMNDARRCGAWSLLFIAALVLALPSCMKLANDPAALERGGSIAALVAGIMATATAAAASALLFTVAASLAQDVGRDSPNAALSRRRTLLPRALMIIIAAGIGYAAAAYPVRGAPMLAWSFSLAAAGLFPALVLGIWWQRLTPAAAVLGMLGGFATCLFYIVVTRYFPQAAIAEFGMSALSDPVSGRPLADAVRILADPRWRADVPAGLANPLASKVGWFNVANDACGIFGLASGFGVMIIVSLLARKPSAETEEPIGSIRIPSAGKAR